MIKKIITKDDIMFLVRMDGEKIVEISGAYDYLTDEQKEAIIRGLEAFIKSWSPKKEK